MHLDFPIEEWRRDFLVEGLIITKEMEKEFLTPMALAALIREIHTLMRPKPVKDVEVYIGAFQKDNYVTLDIIPKKLVREWKNALSIST